VRRLSHLPVRVRVTLAFAGAMALVLGATGLFLYLRLGSELDATIDQGLRSRAADLASLVRREGGRAPLAARGENLAQVIDSSGRVLDGSPGLRDRPLLRGAALRRALRGPVVFERGPIPGTDTDEARFVARPAAPGTVVVVGASLEGRGDALENLQGLLMIGLPAALLLSSLAGYAATAAALRPVDRMRRRAAEISADDTGRRLPVPPARDEIGRLGETLNTMLARLEAAFDRERRLVADASHELRTPLAVLKSELELALRGGRSPEELEGALRSAAEETDRLAQLTEDLLVIAASDGGRLPVQVSDVDAGAVLEGVRSRFDRRARERGADLLVTAPPGLRLAADPLRLEQALGNLVDNALRYGGPHVELAAEVAGDHARLHVRDDGSGFPDGFAAQAFERFTRADAARGRGGAGLGLAIVETIARAHGGSAGASNRPRGGADVWVDVPRARTGA
jgi:signal transduction histidine kinase